MREFFGELVHALEGGEAAELVSVLESSGSTPRGAGAMMAVFPDGRSTGTVGGGNVEYEAQKLCAQLLPEKEDALRRFRFVQGDAASLGMVCGGDVTLLFTYLPAGDDAAIRVFRRLMELSGGSGGAWLLRRLEGERVTAMEAVTTGEADGKLLGEKPVLADGWFSVPVERPGRVYLFGGGHVSQALVPVLSSVGFRVVVYDDRPEFADPALFPAAEETLCGDFLALERQVHVTADDYVVIMTRGHQADYEVLCQVLRSGARYLGCIGSRRKLALCRERLLAAGFTEVEYARLHAPIGLPIGAETTEEIAVSVAAELIGVRAGKLD